MFSDGFLEEMGINPERCRAKAKLFRAMASRLQEEGPTLDGPSGDEELPQALRDQRLEEGLHDGQVGSLYQISAECSFLMEGGNGRDAARLAAKAFMRAEMPYGMLLIAVFDGSSEEASTPSWEQDFFAFARIAAGDETPFEERSRRDEMRSDAMAHPEQMVWLLLAAANTRRGHPLLGEAMGMMREKMDDHGHLPVGPLGIPVSAHLHLLDAIRNGETKSPALVEVFNLAMARRSEALNLAKRNEYLWERVRSPVSLFDIHIFALANAAVEHDLMNENTFGDMYRSLDRENPLIELVTAPMKMALDQIL